MAASTTRTRRLRLWLPPRARCRVAKRAHRPWAGHDVAVDGHGDPVRADDRAGSRRWWFGDVVGW